MVLDPGLPLPRLRYGHGKVLVVDDSSAIRLLLENMLSAEHQVVVASNGPEALDLAVRERPDVILLDLVMAGMDGFAVCARLKSDPRTEDIPVLFLTSRSGEEEETLALEAGAIDFVLKPFRPKVVAARIRNHVELKQLRDQIRQQALVDGLTGVANRRRLDEDLPVLWSQCASERKPMTLIMLDVDYFKRFNDHLGHPAGDACLQGVASLITRCLPFREALLARYGGEEFVCLLPGMEAPESMAFAERLRAEVEALGLPHPASDVAETVTISLGVASSNPFVGGTPMDLLLRADERLYRAKQDGRNRVCG